MPVGCLVVLAFEVYSNFYWGNIQMFPVFSFPSEYQFHFPASANPLYLIEILFHSVSGVPTQMLQTCLFPKGVIYNYNTEKEPALHLC